SEPRRLQRAGLADEGRELREAGVHDPAPVVADGRPEVTTGGDEERDAPTEAEADDAGAGVGPARVVEVGASGVDVDQDAVVAETLVLLDDLGEVAVRNRPSAGPVEEVGCDGVV